MTAAVVAAPQLPETGRNGMVARFRFEHSDGRTRLAKLRRIVNGRHNGWEVEHESWFVFEPGWRLASSTPEVPR